MSLSNGAYLLKRGDTYDYEDSRMSHRLRRARMILENMGIKPVVEHCNQCKIGPSRGPMSGCWDACKTVWPEWVTNEVFQAAFNLADITIRANASKNWKEMSAA